MYQVCVVACTMQIELLSTNEHVSYISAGDGEVASIHGHWSHRPWALLDVRELLAYGFFAKTNIYVAYQNVRRDLFDHSHYPEADRIFCVVDEAEKLHQLPDDYLADLLPVTARLARAMGLKNYNVLQNNGV